MRRIFALAALAALVAAPTFAGEGKADGEKLTVTGFITDTHCGEKGATADHTAGCVKKCMQGGSHAQIMAQDSKTIYNLDKFDENLKTLVGKKVTVEGKLNKETNTITVASAKAAEATDAQ